MGPLPQTKFQQNPSSRSRDMKTGCSRAHVHICPAMSFAMSFAKRDANGSTTTYKIAAQSVQQFSRYKNGVSTCHVQL